MAHRRMLAREDLASARRRIALAYDAGVLQGLAQRWAALLGEHFEAVIHRTAPVLNWAEPLENVVRASKTLQHDSQSAESIAQSLPQQFESLVKLCLTGGNNLHHPRYIGHQVPAPVPIAGLFDAIGAITNQVMAIYEMGPWATAVEAAMVEQLGAEIGFAQGEFAGLITSGGSLGNLTGLLTARNVRFPDAWRSGFSGQSPPPALVVHADAHYSTARAAGILGIGTDQIIKAPIDELRRIDPQHLDELLSDLAERDIPVIAVCGCACATPIGAFDPLADITEVCRRHNVWLHVDAAHGGAAALSRRHRHLVNGLAEADSVVCDAHKMLFVPALCAFTFYKNKSHRFAAFEQTAPYLFDPSAPGMAEYDSGLMTVECTKRAAAFGLWGVWSLFGRSLFEDMVDVTFDLAQSFYELLCDAEDFTPLHVPQCNIVAFRYTPPQLATMPEGQQNQFQLDLRRKLIKSGEFYIVPCKIDGRSALRATIINPQTTLDDLVELLSAIRRYAEL